MTTKIVWNSSFETGVPEIDTQHQELVRIINAVSDAIGTSSPETLTAIIMQLKDYALYHFKAEETLMAEHGYADIKAHQNEHEAFADQVLLFDLDAICATEGLAWEMMHFLRGWLTNHILNVDKKFTQSLPQ